MEFTSRQLLALLSFLATHDVSVAHSLDICMPINECRYFDAMFDDFMLGNMTAENEIKAISDSDHCGFDENKGVYKGMIMANLDYGI